MTSKPSVSSDCRKRWRVARILARVAAKIVLVLDRRRRGRQAQHVAVVRVLHLHSSAIIAACATAKPKRMPARAYDLLSVRVTIRFVSCRDIDSPLDIGEIDIGFVENDRAFQICHAS